MTQPVLFSDTEIPLRPQTTGTSNLLDIVIQFKRDIIKKPPHQRDPVWNRMQKDAWIERIRSDIPPVGVIVTYQLTDGSCRDVYLNDGHQRLMASREYLDNPECYDDDSATAEEVLRACAMPLEHRHYPAVWQAVKDFQGLNLGTALLPFDYCRGMLCYIPNYDQIQPLLETVHKGVDRNSERVTVKESFSPERKKNFLRHDYAMFYRFLSNLKDTIDYRVATQNNAAMLKSGNIIEEILAKHLTSLSVANIGRQVELFIRHLERETENMEHIWFGVLGHTRSEPRIRYTLYRWILELSIIRRNNNIEFPVWDEFMTRLLSETQGRTTLIDMVTKNKYSFGLGKVSHIRSISRLLRSEFYDRLGETKRRRVSKPRGAPGQDVSHIQPISKSGDGPTICESASRNRSRGARPMSLEDYVAAA